MDEAGIEASVGGRVKHFFSIYKKMIKQNKTLDQIYDLFAVRIMVETVKDCYAALGVIHEMYKPCLLYTSVPECFCAVWMMELWLTGEFIWIISLSYGIRYGT